MKIGDRVRVELNTLNNSGVREATISHIKGCRVTITFDNNMSVVTHERNIISIVQNCK